MCLWVILEISTAHFSFLRNSGQRLVTLLYRRSNARHHRSKRLVTLWLLAATRASSDAPECRSENRNTKAFASFSLLDQVHLRGRRWAHCSELKPCLSLLSFLSLFQVWVAKTGTTSKARACIMKIAKGVGGEKKDGMDTSWSACVITWHGMYRAGVTDRGRAPSSGQGLDPASWLHGCQQLLEGRGKKGRQLRCSDKTTNGETIFFE